VCLAQGELTIPAFVSAEAQDFLRAILMQRPEERLGSGPGGGQEIKSHPLFHHVDWDLLEKRQIAPPFKPRLKVCMHEGSLLLIRICAVVQDGIMDLTNIDPGFLNEPAVDSPPGADEDPALVELLAQKFQGFTYVDPGHLGSAAAPPATPKR